MWGRVHNRNRDRGGQPVRRLGVGHGQSCPRSIRRTGGAPAEALCSVKQRSRGLISAMLMLVPSLHAQGIALHNRVATPALTFAPQQHLAQQYDPPRMPPEIMLRARGGDGLLRLALPATAPPLLDPSRPRNASGNL